MISESTEKRLVSAAKQLGITVDELVDDALRSADEFRVLFGRRIVTRAASSTDLIHRVRVHLRRSGALTESLLSRAILKHTDLADEGARKWPGGPPAIPIVVEFVCQRKRATMAIDNWSRIMDEVR
ncbi:hypothetical protein SEA_NEOS5_67 [Mycobacterium phage Neos5]|uniref:Uncharacterized protein n=1 Tax=Mycobacterium phage Obutu TaxID=2593350 RepID=A0A514TY28_9CAUD|nr:hypothetical protein KNU70_gp069 [Mycobacterium phage Obutu]AXH48049.1 hypothetical protein SEA_MORTY007_66 [Mycobacterium phage Morty007]AZF93869.1 hypothetical protein SEA_MARLEY1013_68 [Mycobacterium phage Marley1013]QYW01680.1 hypothetical protein SEA_NEOS5_67 [Mycobacterium phage Neos5]UYL86520.1 hypothetical protein SEA_BRIAKILA_67 [Mycobacterium phage Briakila]WNA13613.1 hypothetical protein SEA_PHAYETA_70 [Mycobacterium phage Phayeta]